MIPSIPANSSGWVKFYRQALENAWLQNHRLWAFWSYCLLKASHKDTEVTVGYQRVSLKPGQFVFGRVKASMDLAMTETQIRTCLNSLKMTGNITSKSASKYSIITIVNWHSYQSVDGGADQQCDHQTVQEVTGNRPATDHIQEVKEVKTLVPACVSPKLKRSTRPPSGDQQTFIAWWCFAYEQTSCKPYLISGKDAKAAADLLNVHSLKPLVVMGAFFLTCQDEWLGTKRDLPMFRSMINRIPGPKDSTHDANSYRAAGIIPPDGVKLEDWRFWEQNNTAQETV